MTRRTRYLAAGALTTALWEVLSSMALVYALPFLAQTGYLRWFGRFSVPPDPYYGALQYLTPVLRGHTISSVTLRALELSACIGGVGVLLLGCIWLSTAAQWKRTSRRLSRWPWQNENKLSPLERGVTDNHGHAVWMKPWELVAMFRRPSPYHGAKIVGKINGRLLYDDCLNRSGISLEFSGTRSGKTTQIVTTLAHWEYPQVVLDPKCEIGPMMWRYLTEKGRKVYIVNPNPDPKDVYGNPVSWKHLVSKYNPIDWIDPEDPLASSYVSTTARYFFDQNVRRDANADFFREEAANMIAAILAHILWAKGEDAPPKTLAELRRAISLDRESLITVLTNIHRSSDSAMARDLTGPIADGAEEAIKQFRGVHEEAARATSWLANPALADMVSGSDFHTSEITGADPVTVILQKPMHVLLTYPGLARVLFGSLMNAKIASGTVTKTLFLPDECWLLGKLEALRIALVAGSGHGIALHMPWQSLGQMEEIWGQDGRKTWLDNAAYYSFSNPRDPAVTKMISDACGTYGVLAYSEGSNRGVQAGTGFGGRVSRGQNVNVHEIKRQLIMPAEVSQDLEPREDVVVLGLGKPALIKRAPWMEDPELAGAIERSPYEEEVA